MGKSAAIVLTCGLALALVGCASPTPGTTVVPPGFSYGDDYGDGIWITKPVHEPSGCEVANDSRCWSVYVRDDRPCLKSITMDWYSVGRSDARTASGTQDLGTVTQSQSEKVSFRIDRGDVQQVAIESASCG